MDMKKYADLWIDPASLAPTGDLAVILSEGEERTSTFGTRVVTRPVFLLEHNKEQKFMSFNKKNVRELIQAYGEDSKMWVSKVISLVPCDVQVGREVKLGIKVKPHRGPIPQVPIERVL